MSLDLPEAMDISGESFRVGIAAARFNQRHVDALLNQGLACLKEAGVKDRNLDVVRVPGSNELPMGLSLLSARKKYDVLIALGVLIRGDTIHYELIADAATQALQRLALDLGVPVINGVVVAESLAQANARCFGKIPRGTEFARSALEMAALKRSLKSS